MSTNAVFLMGNLTRDPELRYTQSGTPVAKMAMAVNERFKKGEEWEEKVHFFNITVWSKQAESCAQYLTKGSRIFVEGKLQWSAWETSEGEKRSAVDVKADKVRFLDRKKAESDNKKTQTDTADGEVPF